MESLLSSCNTAKILKSPFSPVAQQDVEMQAQNSQHGEDIPAMGIGEQQQQHSQKNQQHTPKRRIVIYSAFVAILAFALLICNSIISLAKDLLRDEDFLMTLNKFLIVKNYTAHDNSNVTTYIAAL